MTPERLQFFKDWLTGSWSNGTPHIAEGTESWTQELVAEIVRLKEEPSREDNDNGK